MSVKGLPKLNQFCLDEQPDVQLAIMNFKYCPAKYRLELANNINRRLREMKYSVSCPEDMKSYIDREYVSSYTSPDNGIMTAATSIETYARHIKLNLSTSVKSIVKDITTDNFNSVIENYRKFIMDPELWEKLNILKNEPEVTSFTESIDILSEMLSSLNCMLQLVICEKPYDHLSSHIARDIVSTYNHVVHNDPDKRTNLLIQMSTVIKSLNKLDVSVSSKLLHTIVTEWSKFGESYLYHFVLTSDKDNIFDVAGGSWSNSMWLCNETELYLKNSINEKYGVLHSVNMGKVFNPIIKSFNQYLIDNRLFKYEPLFNMLNIDTIRKYIPLFTFDLNNIQVFTLRESGHFDEVYQWVICNEICYVGIKDDEIFLLGRKIDLDGAYIVINIDNASKALFVGPKSSFELPYRSISRTINTAVTESVSYDIDDTCLTEGIDVTAEGDVIFTFSPKKTFMDQYAENHRLLVENSKNGNYESMKTNLAFLFAMISVIEREYIYGNKKVNSKKLEDAKKARTFAYNDFNTYMKQVQQHDKDFDFTSYYVEKGYDKLIFTVSQDNIKGIKKLFNQLLLGNYLKV